MGLQGGSYNLQGGTGIPLYPSNPQPTSSVQLQPATNVDSYGSVPVQTGDYSGSTTLGATTTAPDPYAAWGGTAAYNNLVSGFNNQDAAIHSTASDAANNAFITRKSNILDFITGLQQGQRNLDEQGIQNTLAKKQGFHSILDMVGRGIRSGGVLLAGRNAASGSALEQVSRAYGDYGNRQNATVNNQFELAQRDLGNKQSDFNTARDTNLRKFGESKQQSVTQIVDDARNRLAALDAAMASASLPDRINIEAEKNQILSDTSNILSQFDPQLQSGAAGVAPKSQEQINSEATGLYGAGSAAANPFNFNTQTPAAFQNTGPAPGGLPIFTAPRKKTT